MVESLKRLTFVENVGQRHETFRFRRTFRTEWYEMERNASKLKMADFLEMR